MWGGQGTIYCSRENENENLIPVCIRVLDSQESVILIYFLYPLTLQSHRPLIFSEPQFSSVRMWVSNIYQIHRARNPQKVKLAWNLTILVGGIVPYTHIKIISIGV